MTDLLYLRSATGSMIKVIGFSADYGSSYELQAGCLRSQNVYTGELSTAGRMPALPECMHGRVVNCRQDACAPRMYTRESYELQAGCLRSQNVCTGELSTAGRMPALPGRMHGRVINCRQDACAPRTYARESYELQAGCLRSQDVCTGEL